MIRFGIQHVPNKNQKKKSVNNVSETCKFELPVYHDVSTGRLCVRANSGRNLLHTGHSSAPREYTNDSLANIPRPALKLAIDLLEKNVPTNMINIILEVQAGRSLSSGSLKQLRNVVLEKKHQKGEDESAASCLKRIMDDTDGCRYFCMR